MVGRVDGGAVGGCVGGWVVVVVVCGCGDAVDFAV